MFNKILSLQKMSVKQAAEILAKKRLLNQIEEREKQAFMDSRLFQHAAIGTLAGAGLGALNHMMTSPSKRKRSLGTSIVGGSLLGAGVGLGSYGIREMLDPEKVNKTEEVTNAAAAGGTGARTGAGAGAAAALTKNQTEALKQLQPKPVTFNVYKRTPDGQIMMDKYKRPLTEQVTVMVSPELEMDPTYQALTEEGKKYIAELKALKDSKTWPNRVQRGLEELYEETELPAEAGWGSVLQNRAQVLGHGIGDLVSEVPITASLAGAYTLAQLGHLGLTRETFGLRVPAGLESTDSVMRAIASAKATNQDSALNALKQIHLNTLPLDDAGKHMLNFEFKPELIKQYPQLEILKKPIFWDYIAEQDKLNPQGNLRKTFTDILTKIKDKTQLTLDPASVQALQMYEDAVTQHRIGLNLKTKLYDLFNDKQDKSGLRSIIDKIITERGVGNLDTDAQARLHEYIRKIEPDHAEHYLKAYNKWLADLSQLPKADPNIVKLITDVNTGYRQNQNNIRALFSNADAINDILTLNPALLQNPNTSNAVDIQKKFELLKYYIAELEKTNTKQANIIKETLEKNNKALYDALIKAQPNVPYFNAYNQPLNSTKIESNDTIVEVQAKLLQRLKERYQHDPNSHRKITANTIQGIITNDEHNLINRIYSKNKPEPPLTAADFLADVADTHNTFVNLKEGINSLLPIDSSILHNPQELEAIKKLLISQNIDLSDSEIQNRLTRILKNPAVATEADRLFLQILKNKGLLNNAIPDPKKIAPIIDSLTNAHNRTTASSLITHGIDLTDRDFERLLEFKNQRIKNLVEFLHTGQLPGFENATREQIHQLQDRVRKILAEQIRLKGGEPLIIVDNLGAVTTHDLKGNPRMLSEIITEMGRQSGDSSKIHIVYLNDGKLVVTPVNSHDIRQIAGNVKTNEKSKNPVEPKPYYYFPGTNKVYGDNFMYRTLRNNKVNIAALISLLGLGTGESMFRSIREQEPINEGIKQQDVENAMRLLDFIMKKGK